LNVEGHNVFDLSGNDGTPGAPPVANLNGNLNFNLNNTEHYHQGELPKDYSGDPAYQPLLTVKVPAGGQGMANLANSTVSLSNFGTGPLLTVGDRFYLIELVNGTEDDPGNKAFTPANPTNNTAYARQGMTIGYTFIIDKNLDNLGNEEDTRFLVARLEGMGAPPESKVPNTGRDTGITFLHRGYDMFPLYDCDPCCNPCCTCGPCDPACGTTATRSGWVRTPIADVRGTLYRNNFSSDSWSDVRGALFLGGLVVQKRLPNGRIHLGAFVDAGDAAYDTYNSFEMLSNDPVIRGNGHLGTIGGGLLLRRKWNNGFRLDAEVRSGSMKNRFFSSDLITDGEPARFELKDAYLGTNIGLNHERNYRESTFDVYSRYNWLMGTGGETTLSTKEIVDFETLNSHRLISGGRFTRHWNRKVSSYLGGAYEYELDCTSRAIERSSGYDLSLYSTSLRGGTGIGEMGLNWRRTEQFQATLGLEGYVGKRAGGSGYMTALWKW
ncbi:MAG: hypothetical protein FWD31_02595, partial [Planctomycetaceae bacterium]|nr:hypothetical protein [Planctomycetaceae bacterium]